MNNPHLTPLPQPVVQPVVQPGFTPLPHGPAQLAIALTQPESLAQLLPLGPRPPLGQVLQALDCPSPPCAGALDQHPITAVHLGNEFCERLLPQPAVLRVALQHAAELALQRVLVTPMLSDSGLNRLRPLLALLPDEVKVVVSDWGTLQLLQSEFPALQPVLGRMLNKLIKDPRLPSEKWTRLHPHHSRSPHQHAFLRRLRLTQIEMDVPPFANSAHFDSAELPLSVHLPYGYSVKGRMCRIGSLALADRHKFSSAHACHKECLRYVTHTERRSASSAELRSFQRGNTQFYRHSAAMEQALWQALQQGQIHTLVVAGDWHENHRPVE